MMITPLFRIQNKDKPHFPSMGSDAPAPPPGVKNMKIRENSEKKLGDLRPHTTLFKAENKNIDKFA